MLELLNVACPGSNFLEKTMFEQNVLLIKQFIQCWLDQVEVLAKIYWGDAREKLCDAVDDLKVDNFVLGCRGLGPLKRYHLNLFRLNFD